MKRKPLLLALAVVVAVLLATGGFRLARSVWRTTPSPTRSADVSHRSSDRQRASSGVADPTALGGRKPGEGLRPPDPTRRFTDFTPEERVEFARGGHGPGG